jgi:hypothetical protein
MGWGLAPAPGHTLLHTTIPLWKMARGGNLCMVSYILTYGYIYAIARELKHYTKPAVSVKCYI